MKSPELDASRTGPTLSTVTILDTAVTSTNLGDQIIMEAVRRELADLLAGRAVFTIASHDRMGPLGRSLLRRSAFAVAGGTNLLSSRMWYRSNWKVGPRIALANRSKIVLMGAGWFQYQHAPDPYSRWLLRRLLSRTHVHSVRESYAVQRLASIGFTNVVNTGCPSIWRLTPEYCDRLPHTKSRHVVTALNSYPKLNDPAADRRLLAMLVRLYEEVYCWIQTYSDYEYVQSLGVSVRFLEPSLAALDAMLESASDVDYVGNRLHAGIRALQKGRRAVIVEIDNRAREMRTDFGLPTVTRTDFDGLEHRIHTPMPIAIRPPLAAIAAWKRQFEVAAESRVT